MSTRSGSASRGYLQTGGLSGIFKGREVKRRERRFWAGSLFWWLILWAAWAVRLWHLDASDLTFDEAATFVVANRPLLDILDYLRGAVREHPPVFYLLMRPWMTLAGISEYSLRFFAASASIVGIALTAHLAQRLARQLDIAGKGQLFVATVLPALILALLPFEVYYARDARMYTMTIVWATLSSLLFLPLLFDWERGDRPSPIRLVGLVLVNGLAVFTHYYLAFLIVSQFVSLLLLRRWRALLAWGVAHGVVGLLGLIWLARSPGLVSSLDEAWGRFDPKWPSVGQLRRLLSDLLLGPIRGVPWILAYGWGALVAVGLLVPWLRSLRARISVKGAASGAGALGASGVWLAITILLPVVLAFLMPEPPRSRFLIFVLPFAAVALGQIPFVFTGYRKTILIGLGLAALAISILGFYGLPRTVSWIKSNYGRTIASVTAHARAGDGVLFYGPWQEIQFKYYRPSQFPPITRLPPYAPPLLNPEEAEPVLRNLIDEHRRLWVIPAAVDDVDPGHFVAGWLETNAHPVWTTHDLSLYLPPPESEALAVPTGLVFDGRLQLKRLTADAQAVPAGESSRFALTWAVSDVLGSDVRLDFSLIDAQGHRWLQWLSMPGHWSNPPSTWEAGEEIITRQGVIVPQGAPPGQYRVRMTVVDADSGAPLQPSDADGPWSRVSVDLFAFEVLEPISPPVLMDVGDFVGPFAFEVPGGAAGVLMLEGYALNGLKFTQGNPVELRLDWLAPSGPVENLEVRLQLLHRSQMGLTGNQVTPLVTETQSLMPGYPVNHWTSGRLVSQPIVLPIPPDAVSGRADLILSVLGLDGQPWSIGDSKGLTLSALTIEERPVVRELPAGLNTAQVDFVDVRGGTDDKISLRGYQIDGEARPGAQLQLTYAWHAVSHPSRIYSVFNHLLTPDGQPVAQVDGWPQGGVVLTTQWQPGEYIQDSHVLAIPADAPPGPYLLIVGLYDAASGDRLQVSVNGQLLPHDQWPLLIEGE